MLETEFWGGASGYYLLLPVRDREGVRFAGYLVRPLEFANPGGFLFFTLRLVFIQML